MTRFERVRQILETATGDGDPTHAGKGRFWNRPLEEFKTLKIHGIKVVETEGDNRGARSGLIKALKGEAPFDPSGFGRMPLDREPVGDPDIAFIQKWIDDGCPEDKAVSGGGSS